MINKFQQGGQTDLAIMLFVLGIAQELQADPQLVVLAAQQNPEALKAAVQVFLETQDIKLAAQTFVQAIQQKTQAAKHGAKLNYIKSLKHQCAEDEEVYYYKKGGSVGCGCRKKEDGGEVTKAQKGTAVDKFKNRKVQTDFSKDEKEYYKGYHPANAGDAYPPSERGKKPISLKPVQKEPISLKPVSKVKNEDANAGDAYPPSARGKKPVVKKSCGSKLKKHQNGGDLNMPIPTWKLSGHGAVFVNYPYRIGGGFKEGALFALNEAVINPYNKKDLVVRKISYGPTDALNDTVYMWNNPKKLYIEKGNPSYDFLKARFDNHYIPDYQFDRAIKNGVNKARFLEKVKQILTNK